tara:strand:+ start:495 stop:827 length:333 start_codon:yes stop_codon:yes gene_type:complete
VKSQLDGLRPLCSGAFFLIKGSNSPFLKLPSVEEGMYTNVCYASGPSRPPSKAKQQCSILALYYKYYSALHLKLEFSSGLGAGSFSAKLKGQVKPIAFAVGSLECRPPFV